MKCLAHATDSGNGVTQERQTVKHETKPLDESSAGRGRLLKPQPALAASLPPKQADVLLEYVPRNLFRALRPGNGTDPMTGARGGNRCQFGQRESLCASIVEGRSAPLRYEKSS